jgi:hypothetical protein
MSKRNQKGPQKHAEGQHGDRTHAQFLKQIHQSPEDPRDNVIASHREGKHRLAEGRQQHDEAESGSELTRVEEFEEPGEK